MGECHDVLQAGRGRGAKAGKAALFTPGAVQSTCSAAQCTLHTYSVDNIIVHSILIWECSGTIVADCKAQCTVEIDR